MPKSLTGKSVLITGGTGSFGHHILKDLIKEKPSRIVVMSRDEKKQYDMRQEFEDDSVEFVLGDVRDYARVQEVTRSIDVVFHAAALKHVPHCEFNPMEAVKTNVFGAYNIKRAAINNGVEAVVAVSTDKAVKPVNTMGMTKALQEKIILCDDIKGVSTRFLCVRYGNVIGSRGSVIPHFLNCLNQNKPLPITNREMTRFLLTLHDAIELVFTAYRIGTTGQLFVKKMPACKIVDLAQAVSICAKGDANYPCIDIGIRPGEKIHEVLVSEEEMNRAIETADHYIIYRPGVLKEPKLITKRREYTSENTEQLDCNQLISLLQREGLIR